MKIPEKKKKKINQCFRKIKLVGDECAFGFAYLNMNVYFIAINTYII